ncbi:MAG: hypothetical protein CLLPBCKN_000117 [Chroococcidiopsis cubana SAG 39.79]|nr:hypothetical protein [Chroococcidiopsis cubana SAG 39.79]
MNFPSNRVEGETHMPQEKMPQVSDKELMDE